MVQDSRHNKTSEVRTYARQVAGKANGIALMFVGVVLLVPCGSMTLVGLFAQVTGEDTPGLIVFTLGLVLAIALIVIGNNIRRKAEHVAWTREALERDRFVRANPDVCPKCGHHNPTGSNFCSNCSSPLKVRQCPNCQATNVADAQFCGNCGTAIPF